MGFRVLWQKGFTVLSEWLYFAVGGLGKLQHRLRGEVLPYRDQMAEERCPTARIDDLNLGPADGFGVSGDPKLSGSLVFFYTTLNPKLLTVESGLSG